MAFDTAGNIINDAAVELGLAAVSDPFASTDPNFVQLCRLLKSAGRDLTMKYGWSQFQTEYTLTTTQNVATYSLPADFLAMIPQTYWNRTNRLPLGGPLSPQEWQYLKGRNTGIVFTVLLRTYAGGGTIKLYPDTNTPAGYVIAFEYRSSYWVKPSGQSAPTSDAPSASSDTLYFHPLLIMRALKAAWLRAKGLPAGDAQTDFEETLDSVMSNDSPSPVLRMGSGGYGEPLISADNLPVTGFGR